MDLGWMVKMKNKIITLMLGILLLVSITNVSAVQYFQTKSFIGNDTISAYASVFWGFDELTKENIKSGNPLESYVWYNIYPSEWNLANPDYAVQTCNMTIRFFQFMDNSSRIIYNKEYTGATDDDPNAKYFVKLNKGDGYSVTIDCKFSGIRPDSLDMPSDFSIVTPTWECKACQFYEWSLLEQDIAKAKVIGDNTRDVVGFIKQLVSINFEIVLSLFWLVLIAVSFLGTSLIFVGIYWMYLYLRKVAKIK